MCSGSGKTALAHLLAKGKPLPRTTTTVGCNTFVKVLPAHSTQPAAEFMRIKLARGSGVAAVLSMAAAQPSGKLLSTSNPLRTSPAKSGVTIPSAKLGSTQLVEYQEGGDEAGSRKQSYFVELWDVGASLPSFFLKHRTCKVAQDVPVSTFWSPTAIANYHSTCIGSVCSHDAG